MPNRLTQQRCRVLCKGCKEVLIVGSDTAALNVEGAFEFPLRQELSSGSVRCPRCSALFLVLRPEVLLHANIPMPMHGVAPRTIAGIRWWNATRLAAYNATGHHCIACGVGKQEAKKFKRMEAHELYEIDYAAGRMVYKETVSLCHFCHSFIHSGRINSLVSQGLMEAKEALDIMRHGVSILDSIGLEPELPHTGDFAPWASWRLVFDGKEYPPLYPTYEAWKENYREGN